MEMLCGNITTQKMLTGTAMVLRQQKSVLLVRQLQLIILTETMITQHMSTEADRLVISIPHNLE